MITLLLIQIFTLVKVIFINKKGYPNFKKAREISDFYKEYPIAHWKKLFDEIRLLLSEYDEGKPPE